MSSIEYINSIILTSTATSVTFSNIPQNYQDLVVVISARSTNTNNADAIQGTINSDSSANYSGTRLWGNGSTTGSVRSSNGSAIEWGRLQTTGASNTTFSLANIQILSYSNTNIFKTVLTNSASNTDVIDSSVQLWRNTASINTLLFNVASANSFVIGSTFTLWGVK